jgi:hypothetical protein
LRAPIVRIWAAGSSFSLNGGWAANQVAGVQAGADAPVVGLDPSNALAEYQRCALFAFRAVGVNGDRMSNSATNSQAVEASGSDRRWVAPGRATRRAAVGAWSLVKRSTPNAIGVMLCSAEVADSLDLRVGRVERTWPL